MKTTDRRPTANVSSTSLTTLLRLDESKADKVKAALIAKYPEDKEALGKVFAANMLGPSLWFPAMEMWSARKTEPVEETIAALTSYVKNRDKLGDISQYKTTDQLRGALNGLVSKSAMRDMTKAAKNSADRVYEDSDYVVVFAKSKEASCVYGAGTTWCTAATQKGNLFYPYARNGAWLYYIINKRADPKEDPFAKMSIGFDKAGKISWGKDGGLSVNAVNDGLREKTVQDVLGDRFEPVFAAINKHFQAGNTSTASDVPSQQGAVARQHPALENYRRLLNDPTALRVELEKFAAVDDGDAIIDYIRGLGDTSGYNPDSVIVFFDMLNNVDQLTDTNNGRSFYPHRYYQLFNKFFTKNPQAKQDQRLWNHLLRQLASDHENFASTMVTTYCESLKPNELVAILPVIGGLEVANHYGKLQSPFIQTEYADQNPDIFGDRFRDLAKKLVAKRDESYISGLLDASNVAGNMNATNKLLFADAFFEAMRPDPDDEGTDRFSKNILRKAADICMDYVITATGPLPEAITQHPFQMFTYASPEKKIKLVLPDPKQYVGEQLWWLIDRGGYAMHDLFQSFANDPNNPPDIQNSVAMAVMQPAWSKLSNIGFYQKDLVRLMLGNFKALTPENREMLMNFYKPSSQTLTELLFAR